MRNKATRVPGAVADQYQATEIKNIKDDNRPSFTIQVGPFETNTSSEVFLTEDFPRWTNKGLTFYRFKTGILIFYSGTDSSTEVNGFILISENEKRNDRLPFVG